MGIKFRSLNDSDIPQVGSIVSSNTSVDAFDIVNSAWYGNFDTTAVEHSLAKMHTRKVIKLVAPTFNQVLGRSNCILLARILGIKKEIWDGITQMKLLLDPSNEEYVSIDDAQDGYKYLYGAQIAEYWIKKLDIEKAKLECLYAGFFDFFSSSKNPYDIVKIDRNPGNMQLVDGYWAHYDEAEFAGALKRGRTAEMVKEKYADNFFDNRDTRYTYLCNMKKDKSGLYGMLNYYIVVVPEEMRPKIDGMEHKLTKHYTKVLQMNYNLRVNINASSPKIVAQHYMSLEWQVRKLQYKNQGTAPDVKPDDLAILERVKSKKGQIRMRNLGKRQDYSGRAVVCINPYLPLDVIRVPKTMLPKLLEFHVLPYLARNLELNNDTLGDEDHLSNVYDRLRLGNLDNPEVREEMLNIINKYGILDDIPMILGRQPTLHKQSLQGFRIEMSDLQAIEVNPLVCPAFNMDFDGDQAHIEVPLLPGSVKEVRDLVLTTQNLFLAKTGECTTEPRQDMLYGLWTCTRNTYKVGSPVATYETAKATRQAVIEHKVKVWDTVHCIELGINATAGDIAFIACFPKGDVVPRGTVSGSGMLPVVEIDKKSITQYIEHICRIDSNGNFVHSIGTKYASTETFVGTINALVELGFKVARLYPPNISLITEDRPIPEYDNAIAEFHESLKETNMYYNLGMETADNYKIAFSERLDVLNSKRSEHVIEKLGEDNGYVKLSVSGARGSKSNLLQAFSIKGQVKKNDTESFDALLEHSYATQLTPMEHNVAAYGGRQGQIDKSLKTGDTGYAMRQMWHANQGMSITKQDCGTSEGLTITKKELIVFSDKENTADIEGDVKSMFEHAIVGRYVAGSNKLITKEEAKRLANDNNVTSITIRSPITCKCPCCVKCYGVEWSTHKPAVVGTAVGIIAAQSIGEPGTQLTMKQFQKGGVVGKAEVTSAFDKVDKYIHVADLVKANKENRYPGYDPLAWATGKIITEPTSDISMLRVSIEGSKKAILMPRGVKLKTQAVKGEGLSYTHGDYDLSEILEYSGLVAAQKYLMFKLFSLYQSEVKIKMVHFEVLVACMTRYMIVETDRSDLMVGQYATAAELYRGNLTKTRYIPRLIGVKGLPNASHDALDALVMEGHVEGLSRVCLLGMSDSLTKPINRLVMGQSIKDGSACPNFINDRKEKI